MRVKAQEMTHRERILTVLRFEKPDRVPLLGGWILGDRQHQAITGCTEEEYWRDPLHYVIEAHRRLGVDGMIAVHVPEWPGQYRGDLTREKFESYREQFPTPEDVLAFARSQPSPEQAARSFDAEDWREEFRSHVLKRQAQMGEMVYLPTLWEEVHPRFEWYHDFGYENYLLFMHLYPEAANQFFASLAAVARRKAEMAVQVYQELDLVPLTLIGTDICGRHGPLISPALLHEIYFPHVRYALEPLHDAGIKTVWHSDGDLRPLIVEILGCGVSGFQGFQEECGVDLAELARHRTVDGEKLILWAGPSVTSTLPYGTVEDVWREIRRIIHTLVDECALFILPANNILPDCPVENVIAMHRAVIEYTLR
jgi:hypothetical protein